MTPKKILAIVCCYYGLRSIKQLAGSAWPVWRYDVYEEAREMVCWMLQRHCDLSVEDLQVTVKELQLQWSGLAIRMAAAQARRKIGSGDFAFRLGVQGVEQLLMLELGRCQKCSNAPAKRSRK